MKLSPPVRTKSQTTLACVLTPRPASSAFSLRIVKGPERRRSRYHDAVAPDSPGLLWPPILPCFRLPVSRCSFLLFDTQDGLICSASPIARIVAPCSASRSARSRRSSE